MALSDQARIWVASAEELVHGSYRKVEVLYAGIETSVLICRLQGNIRAYLNQCVHMPRALDSEKNSVIDASGKYLRCSMHGIVYDPNTGESLSTLCTGERLKSIRLVVDEQGVWIKDKRVMPLSPAS